jgi:hypothetical protein
LRSTILIALPGYAIPIVPGLFGPTTGLALAAPASSVMPQTSWIGQLGVRCEACGIESDDLEVRTSTTLLGVLCLTLCGRCAAADMAPPVAVATAVRLVAQHCGHLGIDLDQIAAALAERDWGR